MGLGKVFKKVQGTITSGGLNLLGGGPEGGDDSGANAEAEERRKDALRRRIDAFYGIGPAGSPAASPSDGSGFGRSLKAALAQAHAPDDGLGTIASNARTQLEAENTKLADATRAYYTDQLGDKYQDAERQTRFKLARQGLLGSSVDVEQQGEVKENRDLGATRVDEAVRRAVAGLTGQREQERLSAINLVNAGAGDSAVSAAQAGLRNSLENVSSQQKQDLFTDLFAGGANAVANQNIANNEAALLARYRDRVSSFFPSGGASSSGRITPSA